MAATDRRSALRVVEDVAATTPVVALPGRPPRPSDRPTARPGSRAQSGPDRISVILLSLAAVLVVLALLARQLNASSSPPAPRPQVVVHRIYRTTVVEQVPGRAGGTSVSQSVSSSGSPYSPQTAPTTRSSTAP